MKVYTIDTGGGSTVDTLCYLATRELAEETLKVWQDGNDIHDDGWTIEEREIYERIPEYKLFYSQDLVFYFEVYATTRSQGNVTEPQNVVTAHHDNWLPKGTVIRKYKPQNWGVTPVQQEVWFEWQKHEWPKQKVNIHYSPGSGAYNDQPSLTIWLRGFTDRQILEETVSKLRSRVTDLVRDTEVSNHNSIPDTIIKEFGNAS